MRPSDPSVHAALAFAQDRIRATADGAIVEVANNLLVLMKSAGTYRERGQLAFAQIHILENRELLLPSFASALRDRIDEGIASQADGRSEAPTTDWQSIGLVDAGQIEEKISFERIGQLIAHRSEAELHDLDAFMSGMLRHGWADPRRNRCSARRTRAARERASRREQALTRGPDPGVLRGWRRVPKSAGIGAKRYFGVENSLR